MAKPTITPETEQFIFNYNGVVIHVLNDYRKGTVSFVDEKGSPYKYLFAERTVNYLGGWVKIFKALEQATRYADTRLREVAAVKEEQKTSELIDLMVAINALEKDKGE